MQIEDSVCLVTGAAKRVGRVIALEFARRGARVVVHYNTSHDEALETARQCTEVSGRQAMTVRADLRNLDAIEEGVRLTENELGRIDILVNNASTFRKTPFLNLTREQWDLIFETDLRGPAWFCRTTAPGMMDRQKGVIINVADICGEAPWPGYAPYGVARAGLVSLTRGLARELAPHVRVNAIGPGTVLLPSDASESLHERAEKNALLGRIGSPRDIASACVYLVEGSDFITGAFLPVDGGKSLLGRGGPDAGL